MKKTMRSLLSIGVRTWFWSIYFFCAHNTLDAAQD